MYIWSTSSFCQVGHSIRWHFMVGHSHPGVGFLGTFSGAEVSGAEVFFRGGSFRILKNMCTKYILQPRSFQVFIKGTNDNNGRFFGSLAMDLADIIWRCVHLGSSILLTTTACILYKIFENWVAKGETLCYGSKCWGKNMLPKRHKSMCGHHCLYFFVVYREST